MISFNLYSSSYMAKNGEEYKVMDAIVFAWLVKININYYMRGILRYKKN
jgi:hypothetical protein